MTWDEFYELVEYGDDINKAIKGVDSLSRIENIDELIDVVNIIEDKSVNDRLIMLALKSGKRFTSEQISEIVYCCSESCLEKALYESASNYTSKDLEELYNWIDEEMLLDVAKKFNISLTEELKNLLLEDDEEDNSIEENYELLDCFYDAIACADNVLTSIAQAMNSLNDAENISLINMVEKNSFFRMVRKSSMVVADIGLDMVQDALVEFNDSLKKLLRNKNVQMNRIRLTTISSMIFDDSFLFAITHTKINNAQNKLVALERQVVEIRNELMAMQDMVEDYK